MDTRIITDSCCDLPEHMLEKTTVTPLTVIIDGINYKDGINLTKEEFYAKLSVAQNIPTTASPSPGNFIEKFARAKDVFVVTVSSGISSTYQSAILAKKLYLEQFPDRFVHVFNSMNASVGEGLVVLKLTNLINENYPYEKIVKITEDYIKELKTFFLLENMENLVRSGRVNRILGKIISALNIKFIMGRTPEGEIELFDKVRGSKKAFYTLIEMIGRYGTDFEHNTLGISHCNCVEKAKKFKTEAEKRYNFKQIIITQMGPTIATYAAEGGLLISF